MKNYFEKPVQVCFIDEENTYQYGIAYHNEIICACCGGVFEIDETCIVATYEEFWAPFAHEISSETYGVGEEANDE